MKVEKINDNQIKFEFMAQDLVERNINISDIMTQSTTTTQGLFREITNILYEEYDFAAIGTPLVFEATMYNDILSVLVTRMVGSGHDEYGEYKENNGMSNFQNIINDVMTQMKNNGYNQNGLEFVSANIHPMSGFQNGNILRKGWSQGNTKTRRNQEKTESGYSVFSFENFDILAVAASYIPENYQGRSHVHKLQGRYHLILQSIGIGDYSTRNFESQLCEFGQKKATSLITYNQMLEHGEVIIAEEAVCKLKLYHEI